MKSCKKMLITAFKRSSAETLIKNFKEYEIIFLPNDKVKDSQKLIARLSLERYNFIICFGQRPNIKDKICIETSAKDGEFSIDTNVDCEHLKCLFVDGGISAKISHNAGTSFCNMLYLNGLRYIEKNHMDTKIIFIHVPYKKNISNFDDFRKKIYDVMEKIRKNV